MVSRAPLGSDSTKRTGCGTEAGHLAAKTQVWQPLNNLFSPIFAGRRSSRLPTRSLWPATLAETRRQIDYNSTSIGRRCSVMSNNFADHATNARGAPRGESRERPWCHFPSYRSPSDESRWISLGHCPAADLGIGSYSWSATTPLDTPKHSRSNQSTPSTLPKRW